MIFSKLLKRQKKIRMPKILFTHIIFSFIPAFLGAMIFFVFIIELVDLFANIMRYFSREISLAIIIKSMFLYLPKCFSYAIPISLLFSVSFVLGTLHAENELIIIYGSGISIYNIITPILIIALFISVGSFFFEDNLVIPFQKTRNALIQQIMGKKPSYNNREITLIGKGKESVWHANLYDDNNVTLTGLTIIKFNIENEFMSRLEVSRATWENNSWSFVNARIFEINDETAQLIYRFEPILKDDTLSEPPDSFRSRQAPVDEMNLVENRNYVISLRNSGLPFENYLAEYYKRYSFSLTPIIVVLLSIGTAGRFKKNILLMSLLVSLLSTTLYYVFQMVTMLFARSGTIQPILGAFLPFFAFLFLGLILVRTTRT